MARIVFFAKEGGSQKKWLFPRHGQPINGREVQPCFKPFFPSAPSSWTANYTGYPDLRAPRDIPQRALFISDCSYLDFGAHRAYSRTPRGKNALEIERATIVGHCTTCIRAESGFQLVPTPPSTPAAQRCGTRPLCYGAHTF